VTCIAGLVEDGAVYIGGDSAGVANMCLQVRADAKVFRNGPFLMGFTSSFRMGQLLRYSLAPPNHPDGMEIEAYMVTRFIDAVRQCLKEGGCARKDDDVEEGGTFLVGYRGELFMVEDDYQVGRMVDKIAAVGCAQDVALGALHVLRGDDRLAPETKVLRALEAAERWSAGVRAPFVVESLATTG
jgi:ATP-dependent protease HslVU (ClpYQ) peptidase subunit